MTIEARTLAALKTVGISVYLGGWEATEAEPAPPQRYLTYTYMSSPDASAEDKISEWAHYVYVDLWVEKKLAYATQKAATIAAMNAAGYIISEDRYISESETHHVAMTWLYLEAV
jgi:hypothetical protein